MKDPKKRKVSWNDGTTSLFSQRQFSNNGCLTPQTIKVSKCQEREVSYLVLLITTVQLQQIQKDNQEIYRRD